MKKITLILFVIISIFQAKIYAQSEDDLAMANSLEGVWSSYDANKGSMTQVEDYMKPASAKVKKKAMEKYKVTKLTFKKDFTYERVGGKGKNTFAGKYSFDGDDIILTNDKGKVEERGKVFLRNEDKEMGIVITIDNEKIAIIFIKN
jgi:hypothetical protein